MTPETDARIAIDRKLRESDYQASPIILKEEEK